MRVGEEKRWRWVCHIPYDSLEEAVPNVPISFCSLSNKEMSSITFLLFLSLLPFLILYLSSPYSSSCSFSFSTSYSSSSSASSLPSPLLPSSSLDLSPSLLPILALPLPLLFLLVSLFTIPLCSPTKYKKYFFFLSLSTKQKPCAWEGCEGRFAEVAVFFCWRRTGSRSIRRVDRSGIASLIWRSGNRQDETLLPLLIYQSPLLYLPLLLLFSVLFCSLLFSSLLFSSVLFSFPALLLYSVLFYSLLFCSLLFCSLLFSSLLFSSLLFSSVLFCSLLFSSLLFSSLLFSSPLLLLHSSLLFSAILLLFSSPLLFSPLLLPLMPHFPPTGASDHTQRDSQSREYKSGPLRPFRAQLPT